MNDYMIRATGAGYVMALAVTTKDMAESARLYHHASPVACAALGRLLAGTVMMGDMLKNEDDKVTVQIKGDGPMGGALATADTFGNVKGYVFNSAVILPPKENGHLDVGGAFGEGTISVMKDIGLKDSYNGFVPLYSGEIAEDLTHYFMTSEQTPSSVGLGVLMNKEDMSVRVAGGFILQLLPGTPDHIIDLVEENIAGFGSVTDRLLENDDPKYMIELLLAGMDITYNGRKPVRFMCDCHRDRVRRALSLLGLSEINSIIKDKKPVELKCQFCNKAYEFDLDELTAIKQEIIQRKVDKWK